LKTNKVKGKEKSGKANVNQEVGKITMAIEQMADYCQNNEEIEQRAEQSHWYPGHRRINTVGYCFTTSEDYARQMEIYIMANC
jgi:hypothetical protein